MSMGIQGIKAVFTHPSLGLLIMRVALGGVLMWAGWRKFSGGKETLQTVGANIKHIGIDVGQDNAFTLFFGIMAAGSELVGGALLIIGLLFRISSAFLVFTMLVATLYMYQASSGEINRFGYPMILLFVLLGLLFTGPGKFSVQKD